MDIRSLIALSGFLSMGASAAHFDSRYIVKTGDLNGDSRTDIYLQYQPLIVPVALDDLIVPIAQTRREIGQFFLQQKTDGSFEIKAATVVDIGIMSQWPTANVGTIVGDFNRDAQFELLLKGLGPAIPGAKDQLIFAPTTKGALPLAVRAIDGAIDKFAADLAGSDSNPGYFDSGWYVARRYPVTFNLPVYLCNGGYYPDGSELEEPDDLGGPPIAPTQWLPFGGVGCTFAFNDDVEIEVTDYAWDPTGFSQQAFSVFRALGSYYSDSTSKIIPAARVNAALSQLEILFGVTFSHVRNTALDVVLNPWEVLPSPEWAWLKELLKVAMSARVLATIGGVLVPSELTDEDSFEQYLHYGMKAMKARFVVGIVLDGKKPAYVTIPPIMSGLVAQQKLALPIKDALDSPPDGLYFVDVRPSVPKSIPTDVAPVTWLDFGLVKTRTGLGTEILLFGPTGPGTVAGPFDLPP